MITKIDKLEDDFIDTSVYVFVNGVTRFMFLNPKVLLNTKRMSLLKIVLDGKWIFS